MPTEIEPRPIKIFMSYRGESNVARDWVRLASERLPRDYKVHNYQNLPEVGSDLATELRKRIRGSDVFIAFLRKEYLDNKLTRAELDAAVEISSGSPGGSLKTQKRLVVYLMVADKEAELWCKNYQSFFTYFVLENYAFIGESVLVAKNGAAWDNWIQNIRERVLEVWAATPPEEPDGGGAPTLVILGCPELTEGVDSGVNVVALVTAFGRNVELSVVPGGWYQKRDAAGVKAAREVLLAGPRSLLIQVCDEIAWADNRFSGRPPGEDLVRKLERTGLPEPEAQQVLSRTWFWLPRTGERLANPTADGTAVSPFVEADIGVPKVLFGSATPAQLVSLVRKRLKMTPVRLEAEEGIRDIGPQLNVGLQPYFDPMLFELVSPEGFPKAIRMAAQLGSPVLVAIHDRKVGQTVLDKVDAIRSHAVQFDELIRSAVSELGEKPRIARAVFMVNHADAVASNGVITDDTWELVPVDIKRDCAIAPASLMRLQEKLGLTVRSP